MGGRMDWTGLLSGATFNLEQRRRRRRRPMCIKYSIRSSWVVTWWTVLPPTHLLIRCIPLSCWHLSTAMTVLVSEISLADKMSSKACPRKRTWCSVLSPGYLKQLLTNLNQDLCNDRSSAKDQSIRLWDWSGSYFIIVWPLVNIIPRELKNCRRKCNQKDGYRQRNLRQFLQSA